MYFCPNLGNVQLRPSKRYRLQQNPSQISQSQLQIKPGQNKPIEQQTPAKTTINRRLQIVKIATETKDF
jgi:hypothetical protein